MRFSEFFCPTLRENPADAQVISHQLMLRSGMIRQLTAGIYDILPLGLRVFRKVENIIRNEMNQAGALEVLLPAIHPAELWQETGRWNSTGKELLRMKDRKNRDYCFAPTHEEAVTDLVRKEIRSYRDLPKTLYQIQMKFRDEVRPRFGVMRSREFIMKDAYSFDVSSEAADLSYQKMYKAYENIFSKCGIKFRAVAADSGNIGGSLSEEFMVLADNGEDEVICCSQCNYCANIEKAQCFVPEGPAKSPSVDRVKKETKNLKSCSEVAKHLGVDVCKTLKTLVFEADEKYVAVVLEGDRDINEIGLTRYLAASQLRLADEKIVKEMFGASVGSIGPVNIKVGEQKLSRMIFDQHVVLNESYTVGANEDGFHFTQAVAGKDFSIKEQALISKVRAKDLCPNCKNELYIERGIEVGHVFKLGTKYSEAMKAHFTDENGVSKPMVMGCYGIGVARTAAAAIEQLHDENGNVFPPAIAPFDVIIVSMESKPGPIVCEAENIHDALCKEGFEVLWDDREETAGAKFKDADLLGIPIRITIGKKTQAEGKVEIKARWEKDIEKIDPKEVSSWVQAKLKSFAP